MFAWKPGLLQQQQLMLLHLKPVLSYEEFEIHTHLTRHIVISL